MKKMLLFVGIVSFLAISCGPSTQELAEKAKMDSIAKADSLKAVTFKLDSLKQDSLKKVAALDSAKAIAKEDSLKACAKPCKKK